MKYLFATISVLFCLAGSAANKNPQMHVCRVSGGEYQQVILAGDQVAFCRFGDAWAGAGGLLRALDGLPSVALSAYTSQGFVRAKSCEELGGVVVESELGLSFCQFSDGTWIETETLARGPQAYENRMLEAALRQLGL